MNRRKFLRSGSIVSISVPAMVLAASKAQAGSSVNENSVEWFMKDLNLEEITIDELQQKMASGEQSSKSITKMYLKRIQDIDKNGPELNSVIEINPDAIAIAEKMDAERKAGKLRGPMHGIPVLIKDNINTGDKMMTTAGSLALVGNKAAKDAFIVGQLRNAGAVLLGKTNLSEFANFRSERSTSAWSSRGGQTRCPYILNRNPSGSSAGSGSATAASLCAVSIGTETNGSIVSPSSINGLVGIKPTVGLLSRSGIIPISATQDTAGPMARNVKDAAIFLAALAGVDAVDEVTLQSKGKALSDYTTGLSTTALKGKRIGIEKACLTGGNPDVLALTSNAVKILKDQGATVIEIELVKLTRELRNASYSVLQFEFKDGLNKYLSTANAPVKSLAEVIAYNKVHEPTAMPYFKQEILESSQAKDDLKSKEYLEAVAKTISARGVIDTIIKDNNLDAICASTNGPAGCIDLVNGDYGGGFSFSSPAAMAGYPHITVPMGQVHNLPVGFSFIAGAYKEKTIIDLAYAFEQACQAWKAPKYIEGII